jgi:PadR family transcriptional regulator AphA
VRHHPQKVIIASASFLTKDQVCSGEAALLPKKEKPVQISEPAEYALLGLLWKGPQHGYELTRAFAPDQELGAICRLEQSQMYAYLKKLEHLGYLEGTMETQEGRPPRRILALTTTGQSEFQRWVDSPVLKPREVRLQFLLKLYFAREFGEETIARLITRQIAACEQFIRKVRETPGSQKSEQATLTSHQTPVQDFRVIIQQARIRQIEATIAWLRELSQQAGAIAQAAHS